MTDHNEPTLDSDDAEALDALMECRFESAAIDRLAEPLRARARGLLSDLRAIDEYPVSEPSDALVDATLARIAQAERQQAERLSVPAQLSLRRRLHIPNIVAVAAVLLIAAGVAFPVASQVRASSSQAMCASGLRTLGSGIAAYASDHAGAMPSAPATASILPLTSTSDAGILENARHLEMLSQKGYCDAKCIRCNGARNLSFRVPLHTAQTSLTRIGRSAIAADANPVQAILTRGATPSSLELRSLNHEQVGQNVLFSDGSSFWTITPLLPAGPQRVRDNIWVIRSASGTATINLKECSGSPTDIFLAN